MYKRTKTYSYHLTKVLPMLADEEFPRKDFNLEGLITKDVECSK